MKKLDVKSIFIGLMIGILGVSIVFAVVEKISASTSEKKVLANTAEEKNQHIFHNILKMISFVICY